MTQNKRPEVQIIIQCINLPTSEGSVSVKCISTAIFSRDFETRFSETKHEQFSADFLLFWTAAPFSFHTKWSLVKNKICHPETCRPNVLCTKTYRQLNVVSSPFLYQIQEASKNSTHRRSSKNEIVTIVSHTFESDCFSGNGRMVGEQPKSSARGKNFTPLLYFSSEHIRFFAAGFHDWQPSIPLWPVLSLRFALARTLFAGVYHRQPSGAGPVRTGRRTTKKKSH